MSAAVDATRPDALRPFALYFLILVDTAKGAGMGEAAAIGFVLGTKPASLPELYAPVLINFSLPA